MKTFSTLTIRNLDTPENSNTVKVMNWMMERFNIKTGQEIFEKAVYMTDYLTRQISEMNLINSEMINKKEQEIRELKAEVEKYKAVFDSYEVFQELLLNIKKSKNNGSTKVAKPKPI